MERKGAGCGQAAVLSFMQVLGRCTSTDPKRCG
jgi:hypothetical protein